MEHEGEGEGERERGGGLAWDTENTIMSSLACVSDFKAEKPHKERDKKGNSFLLNLSFSARGAAMRLRHEYDRTPSITVSRIAIRTYLHSHTQIRALSTHKNTYIRVSVKYEFPGVT